MSNAEPPARPDRPAPRLVTVQQAEWLSPGIVRIVFGSPELSGFAPVHADSYVKLQFPAPGADYGPRFDMAEIRETRAREHWPRTRSYTVREWDSHRLLLTIDFVVHGDSGVAGPWAASARPGDQIQLGGPGGAYSPDAAYGHHLLVGDESVVPAIAVALQQLAPAARATVICQVPTPEHRLPLDSPATLEQIWLHGYEPEPVLEAVTRLEFDPHDTHAFIHGEAAMVRAVRKHLVLERGLGLDRLSASGYWKHDRTDEAWRAEKREWLAAADAELAAERE
jgi:NADPH-dependent ferric siderophore reductase